MKKVVVDTNVLISAFVFGGPPQKAVIRAFRECEVYVSSPILQEYKSVPVDLFQKAKIDSLEFQTLVSDIASFVVRAKMVFPKHELFICRDPADNKWLECCLESKVDFLLTGDKDLLEITLPDLNNLPFLEIVTPRAFLKRLR